MLAQPLRLEFQRTACGLLCFVAGGSAEGRRALVAADACRAVGAAMRDYPASPALQEDGCGVLASLA
eukprot:978738-Prymnesium_polylepis.1